MGVVGDMYKDKIFLKSHEVLYETIILIIFKVVYYKSVKQQLCGIFLK